MQNQEKNAEKQALTVAENSMLIQLFEVEELEERLEMAAPPAAEGNNSSCNTTCSGW